jgi:hypothetical protein
VSQRQLAAWRDWLRDPLAFELDGRRFELKQCPARVWLAGLFSDEPADLLLDVLDEKDASWLWEEVVEIESPITAQLLLRIGLRMLGKAAHRPWYEAVRLCSQYAHEYHVWEGVAADRGLGDPLEWPVHRLCDWVYLRIVSNLKEAERLSFEAQLQAPPDVAGDEEEPFDEEEAAEAFMEMLSEYGGGAEPRA